MYLRAGSFWDDLADSGGASGDATKKENLIHANTANLQSPKTGVLNHSQTGVVGRKHSLSAENTNTDPRPLRRPSNPITNSVLSALESCARECRLDRFYDEKGLVQLAEVVSPMLPSIEHLIKESWNVPAELLSNNLALELCKLALFDICIICDDSEAVLVEDRKEDLIVCVRYIVEIIRVLGIKPVKFRLTNSVYESDHLSTAEDVDATFRRISFRGSNGISQALRARVNEKLVRARLRKNALKKPLLTICLLSGRPEEGAESLLKVVTENPSDLVRYSIAQIGDDVALLEALKLVGENTKHCDCTDNYDLVAKSLLDAGIATEMSPELWIVKVLLGAIDKTYAGSAGA